jgi:hypothetical protein
MIQLSLSNLKLEDLKPYFNLQEKSIAAYDWTKVDSVLLTERETLQIQEIVSHLINHDTVLMNEATIWARAIYPLLLLAEQAEIEAWAEVSLYGKYNQVELFGIADGVLGKSIAGRIESPYLVVIEAKKGIEASNLVFQLYGELLAAAYQNWTNDRNPQQEVFGCYTIGDTWKFLRAEIEGFETDKPTLRVEYSREYVEKLEAEQIFKLLKRIITNYIQITKIS